MHQAHAGIQLKHLYLVQYEPLTLAIGAYQMTLPHQEILQGNSVAEVRDLSIHMKRVAVGIKSEMYKPNDDDFQELSTQLFSLATQLDTFIEEKRSLVLPENMY